MGRRPREYVDENVSFKLMDQPCNVKLAKDADYYLDANDARLLPCHPSYSVSDETKAAWKQAWETNQYSVDEQLRARIMAWLTFAEFKHYYFDMVRKRQAEHYQLSKFASPVAAILAKGSIEEIAVFYKIDPRQLPECFFSCLPERNLMTLPVTLDDEYTIDFQELLDYQAPTFSKEMLDQIHQKYAEYTQARLLARKQSKERRDALINAAEAALAAAPEHISADELETLQSNLKSALNMQLAPLPVSLNIFIDTEIVEVNVPELRNPCTGAVVQNFRINEPLLREILQTISSILLPLQLSEVEKCVSKYSKHAPQTSCMEQLQAQGYPREKIPNSILQGSIPGKDTLEVMTHPVIIDNYFMIDYARLQQYWDSNEGWMGLLWGGSRKGLNPFTNRPITSILYLDALKNKTDRFVSRCELFRLMPDETLHHPNFLEEFAPANHYVFFNQHDPLSPPHKPARSLLQNILSCVQHKQ